MYWILMHLFSHFRMFVFFFMISGGWTCVCFVSVWILLQMLLTRCNHGPLLHIRIRLKLDKSLDQFMLAAVWLILIHQLDAIDSYFVKSLLLSESKSIWIFAHLHSVQKITFCSHTHTEMISIPLCPENPAEVSILKVFFSQQKKKQKIYLVPLNIQ